MPPAPSTSPSPSPGDGGTTTTPPGGTGPGGDPDGTGGNGAGPGTGTPANDGDAPIRIADAAMDDPVSRSIGIGLDALRLLDDGHEWLVPLFVVSIPGFLVVLAILGQSIAGLVWLVPARRSLVGSVRRGRGRGMVAR
jgi:hypothetical protein